MAVYCCQTDFMIGTTTLGSFTGAGSVPIACDFVSSFWAFAASSPPIFIALAQPASVGSAVSAGLPS